MKSFFEEYGFTALVAIVLIILIVMATPLGDLVKTNLLTMVNQFMNTVSNQLGNVNAFVNQ